MEILLGDSASMKIGSNADDLTVIENLRAVLKKSTKDMSKDSTEGSGESGEEEGSGERKSKSIDQVRAKVIGSNTTYGPCQLIKLK